MEEHKLCPCKNKKGLLPQKGEIIREKFFKGKNATKSNGITEPFLVASEQEASPVDYQVDDPPSQFTKESSETEISTLMITSDQPINSTALPLLPPRIHGSHCVMEVDHLEKHKHGCVNKKHDAEGRHPIDDKSGSYDVVAREVRKICGSTTDGQDDNIKASLKSFRLNDPEAFGKPLTENRSEIDTTPILPPTTTSSMSFVIKLVPDKDGFSKYPLSTSKEVHKNGHYTGDNCVLHDPNVRGKQILAFQKLVAKNVAAHPTLANSTCKSVQVPSLLMPTDSPEMWSPARSTSDSYDKNSIKEQTKQPTNEVVDSEGSGEIQSGNDNTLMDDLQIKSEEVSPRVDKKRVSMAASNELSSILSDNQRNFSSKT